MRLPISARKYQVIDTFRAGQPELVYLYKFGRKFMRSVLKRAMLAAGALAIATTVASAQQKVSIAVGGAG